MNLAFGAIARGRKIKSDSDGYMIQEELSSYNAVFDAQKYNLRLQNRYFWNIFP